MSRKRALVVALAILYLGQLLYYYPQMPERIASHFNHLGVPDGWMSKSAFFTFDVALLAFFLILFFSLTYFLRKLPDALINLPNKDYWLAPERRAATLLILQDKMETFYIPIFLLFVLINQLVFRANLNRENLSPISWLFIGAFLIFTISWSIGLNREFKVYENRTT